MALVQTSTLLRTEDSGATSTLSYTSNLTAGSLSVLCVGNYPSGITSVSGSTNGAYSQAVTYGDGGNNYVEIWYKANVSAGAETLTITPTSASSNYVTAVAQEWSGVATSSPLDRTGTSGTLTVSTSAATTQADEVVFTVAVADAGSSNVGWGTPSGYTLIARENDSNTYTGLQAAYKIVAATGTQSATHTNSSVSADTIIATFKVAGGATTHATTGALTGQGSATAGTAARTRAHAASGSLAGQGATTVGTAARTRSHAASGVLTGQGSSVAGTAQHNIPHAASGALTGQSSALSGAASRSTGAVSHDTSGALTGQGSTTAGSAVRYRQFAASGALTGQGSATAGSATRYRQFATSGALAGQGSATAGSAVRYRQFATTGVLTGQGSIVVGSATRTGSAVTHATSGALVGPGASMSGSATLVRQYPAPSDVRAGVTYGPGGIYTGTLTATGTGQVWLRRR